MGANGSGKSTLVRALTGLLPARGRVAATCSAPPFDDFHDWQRVGFVPAARRRRRPAYPPRSGRSSPPGGSPSAGCCARSAGADRAAIAEALEVVGLADRARDGVSHALRRPAAAGADRPRPGRRARAVLPRRADRRRRPAQPAGARRHPRDALGARLHDRAGRPRARPDGPAHRPGRGDARRPGRLRRPAARQRTRSPPRTSTATTITTTPRPSGTTTRRTSPPRWTPARGHGDERLPRPARPALHAAGAPRRALHRPGRARRSAPTWCSAGWR